MTCPNAFRCEEAFPALFCPRCGEAVGEFSAESGQLVLSRTAGGVEDRRYFAVVIEATPVTVSAVGARHGGDVDLQTAERGRIALKVSDILDAARRGVEELSV